MKIYVYDSGHVDLEAPIQMTETQRRKFIDFFKENFSECQVSERREPDRPAIGDGKAKKWTVDDYLMLVNQEADNETLSRLMNRTEMSIRMKRGKFLPEFFNWLERKGYAVQKNIDKKVIERFLEEKKSD